MKKVWREGEQRVMFTYEEARKFLIASYDGLLFYDLLSNLQFLEDHKKPNGYIWEHRLGFVSVYEYQVTEIGG